jgi:hypothetical protein
MSRVVSDIAVSVGADISSLRSGLDEGSRRVGAFGSDTETMGRRLARMGKIAGVAALAVATAMTAMAAKGADAAREIELLSRASNASVADFQKMAYGAAKFGIAQDKLADILKDTTDRVGDFLTTGGGPMADFFETVAPKIGITADAFRGLSGPAALQLFVSSLEKANVSQERMTFFMEAMASDATALLPALRNGGKELARFGAEAEAAGLILSSDTIAAAAGAKKGFTDVAAALEVASVKMASGLSPVILGFSMLLVDLIEVVSSVVGGLYDLVAPQSALEIATDRVVEAMADEIKQSQLLDLALASGTRMSTTMARTKLEEARARLKNAAAALTEAKAEKLASGEFQKITADAARNEGGSNGILQSYGPGPGGAIDRDLYDMGAIGRRVSPDTQNTMDDFGALFAGPAELVEHLAAVEENIKTLSEGIATAVDGIVITGDYIDPVKKGERTPGGGAAPDGAGDLPGQDPLDGLVVGFDAERDILVEQYDERLRLLTEFRQSKNMTDEEFNATEARIKAEHEGRMGNLEARRRDATLNGVQGMFGDLSALMGSENKKIFAVGKIAALAEAGISGYKSAILAWEKGMQIGGPPLAAAFAGASVLKTGMLMSKINSATASGSGGSAGGGGAGGSVDAPVAAAPAPVQQVNVSMGGQQFFPRSAIVGLVKAINEARADGASLSDITIG